jgi:hypothetical protein
MTDDAGPGLAKSGERDLPHWLARGHGMTVAELLCSRARHVQALRASGYRYLHARGWSYRAIGRLFNRGPSTVRAALTGAR